MGDPGAEPLDAETRQALLERISRRTATIGERIPAAIEVEGEPFELRRFVWETKRLGRVPEDRREEVRTVRARLKRERAERKERLETADVTREEGTELAATIIGIDRAITALQHLYETDLAERSHEEYVEGNRRWLAFIDQLTD